MIQQWYWRDIQIHHVFWRSNCSCSSVVLVFTLQWESGRVSTRWIHKLLVPHKSQWCNTTAGGGIPHSVLAAILQPSLCAANKVYYVTPDSETTCPSTPCYNISHYIQNLSVYFQSNNMLKFLPGIHILDAGGVVVEFVSNIEQWYNGTLQIWIPLSTIQQSQVYGPIWFCIYVCGEFTHRKLFIHQL